MISSELIAHALLLRDIGEVTVYLSETHQGRAIAFVLGECADNVLVRVQSRCVYGEVFGSVHCDCRDQLDAAWRLIGSEGRGIVIYLDQEGRGAGAVPKAKAYRSEQLTGLDTFETYRQLGIPEDPRSYDEAADLLKWMGLKAIRLLTNNPQKAGALLEQGIGMERVQLSVEGHFRAQDYLAAKRIRGHDL